MDPAASTVTTAVPTEGGDVPVHVWLPPDGHGPGVLLVQEIFGVSDYIRQRAADLAAEGYVVAVPELYWRLGADGSLPEDAPDLLDRAMATAQRLDPEVTIADTLAALAALRALDAVDGPVALVGFCWGGSVAFATAARAQVDALVSFYGSSLPDQLDLVPSVTAPSLHHFGEADSFIPMDKVRAVQDAVQAGPAPVEFHLYPGADHAFDNTKPAFHHEQASALAWQRTLDFLHRHLHGR
jgi:carboxymethylenebutenolidase